MMTRHMPGAKRTPRAPQRGPMTRRIVLVTCSPGLLADLTTKRRGLTLDAYPLGEALLLRASGDIEGLDGHAWGGHRVLRANAAKGALTLLLDGNPDGDVTSILARHGARLVPPIVWARGKARIELDVAAGSDAGTLLSLFPDARLLAKRREPPAPSTLLLPGLTVKRATAIATAFEMGYYDAPKRVKTGDVARRLGVARSTFEEHLSHAEKALIGAMLPMAKARQDPAHALDALRTYGAFSEELGVFVRMELAGDAVRRLELLSRGQPTRESHPYLERVLDHLRTGKDDLRDLPVDANVSGFDKRVLDALRRIPAGKTVTYGELARRLGVPGGARAVGNACAKNPVLVVIPCHRVVPSAGGVGNYAGAGGARTKARLLAKEGGLK